MSTNDKTECSICTKEVVVLERFNGELMCEDCYRDPENQIFDDEEAK